MRNNNTEYAAIKTLAISTDKPFWVAFKATMGVALAQLILTVGLLTAVAAISTVVYLVTR